MKERLALVFLSLCLGLNLHASPGYRLKLQDKDPLYIRVLDSGGLQDPLPLKEPILYLGGSVTWLSLSRVAELELGSAKARLMLGEPWIYIGERRLGLPQAPEWKDGRLILDKASLDFVIKSLSSSAPALETVSAEDMQAFSVPSPTPEAEPSLAATQEPQLANPAQPLTGASPARGAVRRIVIDAGHGGHDPGARGPEGLEEKDTCLDIALRLQSLIKKNFPDIDVLLTRSDDTFISLRQRTVIANDADADLFISIHNNASPNSKGRGSQVFFYDSRSSDRAAEDLATRENEDANYLDILMTDLAKSLVRDQSILLAQCVQNELASDLGIHSRRLSYAPFYVLARTKMPAILVEVAFITNPREEELLRSSGFRAEVAEGIFRGVTQYSAKLGHP